MRDGRFHGAGRSKPCGTERELLMSRRVRLGARPFSMAAQDLGGKPRLSELTGGKGVRGKGLWGTPRPGPRRSMRRGQANGHRPRLVSGLCKLQRDARPFGGASPFGCAKRCLSCDFRRRPLGNQPLDMRPKLSFLSV